MTLALARPSRSAGWELRTLMALGRRVRVTLSDRCDGVRPRPDGTRQLEGLVSRVSATDAWVVIADRHVPLADILAVHRPHFEQGPPSDPGDQLDDRASRVARLRLGWNTS